jgi:mono/diheme cytochrome c family protein
MKRSLILLLLAASPAAAQSFGSPSHFTEEGGAALYAGICAGCHMPDGRGAVGAGAYPSLQSNPKLAAPGYPIGMVLRGHGAMPGFGRTLSDRQIADVIGFLRTHFGNAFPEPVTPDDVKAARE